MFVAAYAIPMAEGLRVCILSDSFKLIWLLYFHLFRDYLHITFHLCFSINFGSRYGQEVFLVSKDLNPGLRPTHPPSEWVLSAFPSN
jgi:hypothetical protein